MADGVMADVKAHIKSTRKALRHVSVGDAMV
jgi:hypothetical protein